ncbi:hypothetical protein J4230_03480 [Candidatus Woesearchaeota archaeon]|nr:hypothetical protein [Candidatus Woesearchaeota archaeon]
MRKIQINMDWSVVFWLGVLTVFLWLIAKAVGLIHTPQYIEAILYIGGLVAIGAIVKSFGKYAQKIDTLLFDVKEIKLDLKELRSRSENHEIRLVRLET